MYIFIISFILTAIVSACFFKKRFWENRYLILVIGACVALVATLTTNFIVRGHLEKKVETIWTKPLYTFYMPDSIIVDSIGCERTFLINYNYYSSHKASEFYKDSTKSQTPVSLVLYTTDKKGKGKQIGIFKSPERQDYYEYESIYLAPSSADSIISITKKKQVYSVPSNKWLTSFSFPRLETIVIINIPPREYAMIPDSLIRKLPF